MKKPHTCQLSWRLNGYMLTSSIPLAWTVSTMFDAQRKWRGTTYNLQLDSLPIKFDCSDLEVNTWISQISSAHTHPQSISLSKIGGWTCSKERTDGSDERRSPRILTESQEKTWLADTYIECYTHRQPAPSIRQRFRRHESIPLHARSSSNVLVVSRLTRVTDKEKLN